MLLPGRAQDDKILQIAAISKSVLYEGELTMLKLCRTATVGNGERDNENMLGTAPYTKSCLGTACSPAQPLRGCELKHPCSLQRIEAETAGQRRLREAACSKALVCTATAAFPENNPQQDYWSLLNTCSYNPAFYTTVDKMRRHWGINPDI